MRRRNARCAVVDAVGGGDGEVAGDSSVYAKRLERSISIQANALDFQTLHSDCLSHTLIK